MSNHVDRHYGAMRIFEALSSVDQELLERSEKKAKVISFPKAAKAMTACAGLLIVGVVTWTGMRNMKGMEETADACAAADQVSDMTMADTEYSAEERNGAAGELAWEETESLMPEGTEEEKENDAVCNVESVIAQKTETLTEEELRAVEVLGKYIPTVLPMGYTFENGYKTAEGGISVFWSKGMETIKLSISFFEETQEEAERIADIARPETYDVHRYEIPYASTVAEEYWTVFQAPIFREKDLSAEVVRARMESVADLGDTDTQRGNFDVLYDSGVLVHFSGDGSAEQIWEMFETLGE